MTQSPKRERPLRIRVRRLMRLLMFGLILPMTAAFLLDALIGSAPWVTLVAILVCIPLTTVLVSRAALHEMDTIIQVVAPVEATEQSEYERSCSNDDSPDLTQSSSER